MQELVVQGPGQVGWRRSADPVLDSPIAALVRPLAVATCDFDHLVVAGAMPLPGPVPVGHECVAEVVAVGSAVDSVRPGERVIVPFQVSCGTCGNCRRGRSSSCARMPWLSCYGLGEIGGNWGGALADILLVPFADAMLVPLPPGLDPAHAAQLGCNLPDAHRAVCDLGRDPGAVLVAGGAFANIARNAVALARALGAERVDYLDPDHGRRDRATALGAAGVDRDTLADAAYPFVVEASMDADLLPALIAATAPAGVLTVTTIFPEPVPLPLFTMFQRCLTVRTGQPDARDHIGPVLDLIATGALDPAPLVDAVADWDDAPDAFRSGKGKIVCVRS